MGNNDKQQCGLSIQSFPTIIKEPTIIEDLKDYEIDMIQCGWKHSWVRTTCNKYFAFGCNEEGECVGNKCGMTCTQYRLDEMIRGKYKGPLIDVHLGQHSTKLIVSIP